MILFIPEFVTPDEESSILRPLGAPPDMGRGDQRNRIVNYGRMVPDERAIRERAVRRRLRSYRLDPDESYAEIPDYFKRIIERIMFMRLMRRRPALVTINEYLPGQGVQLHLDLKMAGPEIVLIGLAGDAVIEFSRREERHSYRFARLGLLKFDGEHRYEWLHAIAPVAALRYSVVFRQQG